MDFLGVGYQEVILITFLLLVVVGPARLPAVAFQIGRAVRTLQSYARVVRGEFSEEFKYLDEQYKTVKGEVDTARGELRIQQSKWNAEIRQATAPIAEAGQSLSNVVSITDGQPLPVSGYLETMPAAIADPTQASAPSGDPVIISAPPALPVAPEPVERTLVF